MCLLAEFEQLETAEDYEKLIRESVRGVPLDWPSEIAKQCLFSPTSSNGKRYFLTSYYFYFAASKSSNES